MFGTSKMGPEPVELVSLFIVTNVASQSSKPSGPRYISCKVINMKQMQPRFIINKSKLCSRPAQTCALMSRLKVKVKHVHFNFTY